MSESGATQADPGERCPDLEAVNAVLDREAPEEIADALRRHVSRCATCREQFGELFEVDALAPAIFLDGAAGIHDDLARRRRVAWPRPHLAAAALILAAVLVVLLRLREGRAPDLVTLRPPPVAAPALAPPRLVASRRVESEIVVDGTGVHGSIRRDGDRDSSAFQFEKRRSGGADVCWSSLLTSSPEAREAHDSSVEKAR